MNFEAKGSSSSSVSPPSTLRDCDATHDTDHSVHHSFDPFDAHYCSTGTAIKHPVLDRLNPVWYRMLYSCTHTATVGVKGLTLHASRDTLGCHLQTYTYRE